MEDKESKTYTREFRVRPCKCGTAFSFGTYYDQSGENYYQLKCLGCGCMSPKELERQICVDSWNKSRSSRLVRLVWKFAV